MRKLVLLETLTAPTTAAPTMAGHESDCVGDCGDFDKFCTDHLAWAQLGTANVVNNNLGGLGPGNGEKNIK